jgi:hypothetical protein
MLQHTLRATPWLVLGSAAAVIPALLRVVEKWPYTMWPLEGIAVGFLAGSVVWAFDEPAASIVDTLPRSLAWRTAARCTGVVALLAWWLAAVAWTQPAYFGHAEHVALQGVAAAVAATAFVTWRRRRGSAAPAGTTGAVIVACSAFVALARPFDDALPVFPYTAHDAWTTSTTGWAGCAAAAVGCLAATLTETRTPILARHSRVTRFG